ncbi:FAD/NAD(P)-binding protein [Patescibacteria group bacterium]|nr:FAD/NAD(P)-binding protein [Patescibacteria group bacterium]
MRNQYKTYPLIITNIESQNVLVKVFTLKPEDRKNIKCATDEKKIIKCWVPGQFISISIPGFGEAPFAICSSPNPCNEFQICVQKKGGLTSKFFSMSVGDEIDFRGPYGNGFPISKLSKRNLLLIAGGLGLAPLRPLIQIIANHAAEFGKVQLFGGSREEKMMLFKNEYGAWRKNIELNLTLDIPNENWNGSTGLVTALFDKIPISKNAIAIICGPPVMFPAVIKKIKKKGMAEKNIYLLLERRMHCGVGICQHCVLVNGKYVCKDGPVFNYAELKDSPGAI